MPGAPSSFLLLVAMHLLLVAEVNGMTKCIAIPIKLQFCTDKKPIVPVPCCSLNYGCAFGIGAANAS